MLISIDNPRKYESYPVSPSAFKYIEWPLAQLDQAFLNIIKDCYENEHLKLIPLIQLHAQIAFEHFKRKDYIETDANLKLAWTYAAAFLNPGVQCAALGYTAIALTPIVLALTPMTLLADILTGARAVNDAYKKGYPKKHIDLILQKKWIASTVQHAAYFVINSLFFACAWKMTTSSEAYVTRYFRMVFIVYPLFQLAMIATAFSSVTLEREEVFNFSVRSILSIPLYFLSKQLVLEFLPSWTRPARFNIFIKEMDHSEIAKEWKKYGVDDRKNLQERTDGTEAGNFCNRFRNGVSLQELLEIPETYTQEDLKKAYKKWALVFHPDKSSDPDKTILFQALYAGYELSSKKFDEN